MKTSGLLLGAIAVAGLVVLSRASGTSPSTQSLSSMGGPTPATVTPEVQTYEEVSQAPSFPIYNPETFAQYQGWSLSELETLKGELVSSKYQFEREFKTVKLSGYNPRYTRPVDAVTYDSVRSTLRDLVKYIKFVGG